MNCRYCGAGLPSKGGACPSCGRMIPFDQQKMMRDMLDPQLNAYRNKDTAMYKKESASNNIDIGKIIIEMKRIFKFHILVVF